jgi:hypothetical protein
MTKLTTTTDRMVEEFLAKAEFDPGPARKRLIFAIDATASRQPTWDLAANVQSQMFLEAGKYGGLDVQLVYYRGFGEIRATKFVGSTMLLVQAMAKVTCQAGHTQLAKVLRHVARESEGAPVSAVILVGDCCEESLDTIAGAAAALARSNIPVYGFFEGNNPGGRDAFELITETTKGVLVPFDSNSPSQLRELLGAVAAYVVGGTEALADKRPEIVALLTHGGARGSTIARVAACLDR